MTITMFKALKEKVDIINKYMVDLIREMKTIKKEPKWKIQNQLMQFLKGKKNVYI